jgi:GTP cyclohydrolase I
LIGERSGTGRALKKLPCVVAKAMQFLTKGYLEDPAAILNSARFKRRIPADSPC